MSEKATSTTSKATKPRARKVGQRAEVPEGATVTRPDGSSHTVAGGSYVLDVPGVFVIDGSEVTVR